MLTRVSANCHWVKKASGIFVGFYHGYLSKTNYVIFFIVTCHVSYIPKHDFTNNAQDRDGRSATVHSH